MALIPKWGRAIKKANEDATLQVQQAKSSGTRHGSPKDTLLAPTRGLASVGVTLLCFNDLSTYRPVRNGDEDTPHLDSARSVVTACQGLLHFLLIDAWVRIFKAPHSLVVVVAHQFIRHLDRDALNRLWKKRCVVIIAWEKERAKKKKKTMKRLRISPAENL